MIIVLLMLTSSLAGCAGDDTSNFEQQIADLQQSNNEMEDIISQKNNEISLLQELYEDSISDAEAERNSSLDELNSMIEAANSLILTLQSDFVVQQNLVAEWIVRAINNDFSNVNLTDADLSYANLNGAILRFSDLSNANLTYANLGGADLRFADLSDAYLRDAYMYGADLSGADLTGVYWYSTTCPDGTNSDDNGNTCENNL